MAAVLYDARERLKNKYSYIPCDGDWQSIEIDAELDEQDPELRRLLPLEKQRWGLPIKSNHVTTRFRLEGSLPDVEWDYEHYEVAPLISERLKNLIKRFEPGVHQFWPMPVENDQGEVVTMRYWFVICNRIDTFDRELSVPLIKKHMYRGLAGFGLEEGSRPLLRSDAIGGRHAWRDKRSQMPAPFVSTALSEAMQAEGITGAAIFPIDEI